MKKLFIFIFINLSLFLFSGDGSGKRSINPSLSQIDMNITNAIKNRNFNQLKTALDNSIIQDYINGRKLWLFELHHLTHAIFNQDIELVDKLLEYGFPGDQGTETSMWTGIGGPAESYLTPWGIAFLTDNIEVAKILFKHGIYPQENDVEFINNVSKEMIYFLFNKNIPFIDLKFITYNSSKETFISTVDDLIKDNDELTKLIRKLYY